MTKNVDIQINPKSLIQVWLIQITNNNTDNVTENPNGKIVRQFKRNNFVVEVSKLCLQDLAEY